MENETMHQSLVRAKDQNLEVEIVQDDAEQFHLKIKNDGTVILSSDAYRPLETQAVLWDLRGIKSNRKNWRKEND